MIRKKENNKYIILISVLSVMLVISLIFLGIYIYKYVNKPVYGLGIPSGGNSCQIGEVEKISITHIMDKKKIVEFDKYGEEYLDKYQGRKYIEYPVIFGEHNSILDLNDRIKGNVDFYIDNFNLSGEVIDNNTDPRLLCYVKVFDDKTQKNYCSYSSLEYRIMENDKYINIIEEEVLNSENSTGSLDLKNIYYVDKMTGMTISNEEVIKNMDNLSLIKNTLIKFIKENYANLSYYTEWEISQENFITDLDILLSTNSFKIFFDNESTYLYFGKIQGIEEIVFRYKNNEWDDVYDMYHF